MDTPRALLAPDIKEPPISRGRLALTLVLGSFALVSNLACTPDDTSGDDEISTETETDTGTETETGTETGEPDPVCGNGILEVGEQCEDVNQDNTDSCVNCQPAACGDGSVYEGFEECDDGNDVNEDGCLDTCVPASCGDGFVQAGVEQCDNGNNNPNDNCSDQCEEQIIYQVAAGGYHACARISGGKVKCWGANDKGQLCLGNTEAVGDNEPPSEVESIDLGEGVKAIDIDTGFEHTVILADNGEIFACGDNSYGSVGYPNVLRVGDDEAIAGMGPVNIGLNRQPFDITAGLYHTCAAFFDTTLGKNEAFCWGENSYNKLGGVFNEPIGDNDNLSDFPNINVGYPVLGISAGLDHTIFLVGSDPMAADTKGCGNNSSGQLGYPNPPANVAIRASQGFADLGEKNIAQVDAGGSNTLAVTHEGDLIAYGSNLFGVLAHGVADAVVSPPLEHGTVNIGEPVTDVRISPLYHACARTALQKLFCFGNGYEGQLGYGNNGDIGWDETPADVGPVDFGGDLVSRRFDVGVEFTCAVLMDPNSPQDEHGTTMKCWGKNSDGQLGQGNTVGLGVNETPADILKISLFSE